MIKPSYNIQFGIMQFIIWTIHQITMHYLFSIFLTISQFTSIYCLASSERSSSLSLDCYLELDEYNLCVKRTVEFYSCEKSDKSYCCIQLELRNCLKNLSPKCEASALSNEVTRSLRAKIQLMLATFPLLSERPCTKIVSLNQCYPSQITSVLLFLLIIIVILLLAIHICKRYNITITELD